MHHAVLVRGAAHRLGQEAERRGRPVLGASPGGRSTSLALTGVSGCGGRWAVAEVPVARHLARGMEGRGDFGLVWGGRRPRAVSALRPAFAVSQNRLSGVGGEQALPGSVGPQTPGHRRKEMQLNEFAV